MQSQHLRDEILLPREDAAREQRRTADEHSLCAVVNPVIVRAASDPVMSADGPRHARIQSHTLPE